ncbi:hypothetical protein E2C01_089702 [Portunus trituberculatus]|uniref:Uncharacterized protein n=1 Tax=Portunus trituberculatus TaxID=210409 RepID=A0A5B7JI67_PORTR|nr:hypothetical protein [Portunus trituberculatus]
MRNKPLRELSQFIPSFPLTLETRPLPSRYSAPALPLRRHSLGEELSVSLAHSIKLTEFRAIINRHPFPLSSVIHFLFSFHLLSVRRATRHRINHPPTPVALISTLGVTVSYRDTGRPTFQGGILFSTRSEPLGRTSTY